MTHFVRLNSLASRDSRLCEAAPASALLEVPSTLTMVHETFCNHLFSKTSQYFASLS